MATTLQGQQSMTGDRTRQVRGKGRLVTLSPCHLVTLSSFLLVCAVGVGCWQAPSAHTSSRNYAYREIPVDPPGCASDRFEDVVNGGQLFKMYCGSCHNARALAERPFSNYEVAMAHMREQAYLTGKEYRQLIHFLRRWQEVGPPTPDVPPSPKRLFFAQPIGELREKSPAKGAAPAPPPAGANDR